MNIVSLLLLYKNTLLSNFKKNKQHIQPDDAIWNRHLGKSVCLFCYKEFPTSEVQARIQEYETLFVQVCELLNCSLDAISVQIALFADEATYRNWLGLQCETRGNALDGWIYTWEGATKTITERKAIMVHEMSHHCSTQLIAKQPITILEEGLAEYVQEQIVPGEGVTPTCCLPYSLEQLADRTLYFDWMSGQSTQYHWYHKNAHAHAFVRYLVERDNLAKVLSLCHVAGEPTIIHDGERFKNAVQKVYGMSLDNLEAEWRKAIH